MEKADKCRRAVTHLSPATHTQAHINLPLGDPPPLGNLHR